MGQSYKTSKHTKKLHILNQNAIKISIFKLSSNKKWIVLLTLCGESSKKLN